ncbi:MAG TPA: 1-acyl-sn-glycerol-3-phosphate acyltransferase [Planktothrix sp.]|jgi:1-acyl-sn-glycerol-3-phosphate acyltransferase
MQYVTHHLLLTAVALAGLFAVYRFGFWVREGGRMQKGGYLPPAPSLFGRIGLKVACRLIAWLGVGPIKVTGRENVKYDGTLLVTGNHQFELDFSVIGAALPYSFRQLASANEVSGLRAAPAAWSGHFAVHVEKGHAQKGESGSAVVDACAKILSQPHSRLLMFLQGYLDRECKFDPKDFRTGAVRALHEAQALGDGNLAVLPTAVYYKRTAAHRILDKLFTRHMFGPHNYGASVAIGKPIPVSSLPQDPREATEVLRLEIVRLYNVAKAL